MSDALVSGLLGGMQGMGQATYQLGKDNLEAMRTRLRDEAKAELQAARDKRVHGQAKELQANRQDFEPGENQKNRDSRKELADKENELKEAMLSEKIDSNKLQSMKVRLSAYSEAREILDKGGNLSAANAVLESVGLPGLEEYTVEEESGWGPWKNEKEVGYRLKGSGRKDDAYDLEELRRVGLEAMPDNQTAGKTTQPKKTKGLISKAMANQGPTRDTLPPKMADWDVTLIRRDGRDVPVVITNDGPVEISDEQYQQWRKLQHEADTKAETFIKNTKHVDYIPNTSPRPW
jgi:hypothetical protein